MSEIITTNSLVTEIPTTQSINITYHSITKDRIGLRWTKGNGTKRIILASMSPILVDGTFPVNEIKYTFNSVYGLGSSINTSFCVYDGDGSTALVTGLRRDTVYYFKVFEYNDTNSIPMYQVIDSLNNPSSKKTSK